MENFPHPGTVVRFGLYVCIVRLLMHNHRYARHMMYNLFDHSSRQLFKKQWEQPFMYVCADAQCLLKMCADVNLQNQLAKTH